MLENAYRKDLVCYHGMAQDVVSLFDEMQRENIIPGGVLFLGILSACNHGGLVKEDRRCLINEDFCIQPSGTHYTCMVNPFGRTQCLEKTHNPIRIIPWNEKF